MIREQRSALDTRVHYVRRGSAGSALGRFEAPRMAPGDHLHLSAITPALGREAETLVHRAIDRANQVGASVSFDTNYRAALWTRDTAAAAIQRIARRVTVVMASQDEFDLVACGPVEHGVADLFEAGVRMVLLKRGVDGAALFEQIGLSEEPGRAVPVIDPVGAGDAFAAGFLAAWRRGDPPKQALSIAVAASAHAVTVPGDFEGMPTWEDVDRMLLVASPRVER